MKKFLKEVIFWEITVLITVMILASCVTSDFPIILFLILSAILSFMLGILVKKVFIYPLVVRCYYSVCGVVFVVESVKSTLKNYRKLKKKNNEMKKSSSILKRKQKKEQTRYFQNQTSHGKNHSI